MSELPWGELTPPAYKPRKQRKWPWLAVPVIVGILVGIGVGVMMMGSAVAVSSKTEDIETTKEPTRQELIDEVAEKFFSNPETCEMYLEMGQVRFVRGLVEIAELPIDQAAALGVVAEEVC